MASKYTSKLKGERVLILGGTSGIGFCVAEAALENGATIIISSSKQAKVDDKIKQLHVSYPDDKDRVFGKTCDLSNLQDQEANIIALLEFATENKTKQLDHIVNTTGDALVNPPFPELTLDLINKAHTVRLMAPLMLAKHTQKYLNKSHRSSLTFTSGSGTYQPEPGWTLPPIIGGSLDGLIRTLAVNFAPIRVNGVAPGPVMTEMFGGGQKVSEEKAKSLEGAFGKRLLTGHMGTPEDLAEAYVYLMKDRNVSAIMLVSDGGRLLKK